MGMFDLIKMLADADVDYVVIGGLAVALHGYQRLTMDVDVVLRPVVPFDILRRDASLVPIGNLTVPIASIDHLIALKTDTGRSKDQIDILELRKIQAGAGARQ